MIIDVHIHSLLGKGLRLLPLLREECRKNGVGLCLLSSLGADRWQRYPSAREVRAANEEARALASHSRGLVRWYAYINPQNLNWSKEIDNCSRNGAVGVKLWVSLKDARGSLSNTEKVLDYAGHLKLPVLIHTYVRTAENLPGEVTPSEFMALAARHLQTRLIAAHAGIHWPITAGSFYHLPNVWVDVSGGYPIKGQIEALAREIGSDRILFGSDFHGRSIASQLAKVLLADICDADKQKILFQNAAALFGLHELSVAEQVKTCHRTQCPVDQTEDHFCFCGRWPFFKTDYATPKGLNAALVKHGIKRAYPADLGSIYCQDLEAANSEFLSKTRGCKRIHPLAVVNPRLHNWRSVLEKTPSFAGIILFPALHCWSLSDKRYIPLYQFCRRHKIKLWINCRLGDPRFNHAGIITREVSPEELLRYGDLAEAPRTIFQGVFEHAMKIFLKRFSHDNRFCFEISRLTDSTGALRAILNKFGHKRLVMGSESPFRDIRQVRWTSGRI